MKLNNINKENIKKKYIDVFDLYDFIVNKTVYHMYNKELPILGETIYDGETMHVISFVRQDEDYYFINFKK